MKRRSMAWLRLLLFSWLSAFVSCVILSAVLVGVTLAIGDTEPPRIPEQRSGDVAVPGQTIVDAERAARPK